MSAPRPSTDEEDAPLLERDGEASSPMSATLERVKQGSLTLLEKVLIGIALFFLILAAVFLGLFAGSVAKPPPAVHHPVTTSLFATATATVTPTSTVIASPAPTKRPDNRNDETCLTPECVQIAASLIASMDTTVDPCVDFFAFSNGGWVKDHPIPEDKGDYGTFNQVTEKNDRVIRGLLESTLKPDLDPADRRNIVNLQNLYHSCLNEEQLESVGAEPLLRLVQTVIDHFSLVKPASESDQLVWTSAPADQAARRKRLTSTLLYLHAHDITSLFDFEVDGDVVVDPDTMRLYLGQGGLGLPDKEYYAPGEPILELYESVVAKVLANVHDGLEIKAKSTSCLDPSKSGSRLAAAQKAAAHVVAFEGALAKISLSNVELYDPKGTYHPRNRTELSALLPYIDLGDYFSGLFPRPFFPDPVIVQTPTFFANLSKLIDDTPDATLQSYFVYHTASRYASAIAPSQPIAKELKRLNNALKGVDASISTPRSETCLKATLNYASILAGRYFVLEAFPGRSKEYAEEIIDALIEAYKERLSEVEWFDKHTAKVAVEKASLIQRKIGYPTSPDTESPEALERYYALNGPFNATDFFGNAFRSIVADSKRFWAHVETKRNRGEWEMPAFLVNAYFNPSANEIVFPAGILQIPFFSVDFPEYLAIGAFGSVAGHEIGHAFDASGRQYDGHGRLTDWWSNSTVDAFKEREKCFLKQYANYTIIGPDGKTYHIKSGQTIGEDLADSGGLAQSYRAWKSRFESDPDGKKYANFKLPGLNYTREQLFFLSYSASWRNHARAAERVRRIRSDPHSPPYYRVIGPLQNSMEFRKAFNCPADSPMVRKNPCTIW